MRSIARVLTAALPLFALLSAPVAAQSTNNVPIWLTTTADDDDSPLALFPLEGHPSLNQLTLMCGDRQGLTLRVSAKTVPGPSSITITNAKGGKITLKPDGEGVVPAAGLDALRDLYERTTGMSGDDEPKGRVPFTIASGGETTKASYNFRRFGHTLVWMNQGCADWRKPAATVAAAPAPIPRGPRTRIGGKFEDYCVRHNREPTKKAQCACLTDAVIQVSSRDNPGYQGYPDIVMSTIYAYREAMITGSSPEFDVRMILMGVPGNPSANPAQMIARAVRVNDEAVAMCRPQ